MKRISLLLLIVFCLAACGGGGDDSGNNESVRELTLDETATDTIDQEGEVHMYHINAVENRNLSVNLSSTRKNSPVDFMVTIYEKDDDGNLDTIVGQSAQEDATMEADITINVPINGGRHLYIAVRDFKGDDASEMVKYRLKASYTGEVEDNNTFENAIDLAVGNTQVCYTDEAITPKTDEDCYRFTIGGDSTAGVYRISAKYDPEEERTISVILDMELYDEDGKLVQQFKGEKPADDLYVMLPYLAEGEYFMIIGAQGRKTADEEPYALCIEPVSAEELLDNDTSDPGVPDAPTMENVPGESGAVQCEITGSLEYVQDQDWYEFDVTPAGGGTRNIVINFFHGFDQQVPNEVQQQGTPFKYRVSVVGETNDPADTYTFDHSVLATDSSIVEIGARPGTRNYIMVQPIFKDHMLMAMPYQMDIKLRDLNDPNEQEDPITLTSGVSATGKIAYLGDKDDYEIAVTAATTPKILEVFFSTTEKSEVSYAVTVEWDGKTRVIRDTNGVEDGAVCKSSFYIPTDETVTIQVSDDQNNDGDDVAYTLLANEVDIPTGLPGGTLPGPVSSPVYHGEIAENTASGVPDITVIEYDREIHPQYKANTTHLRVGPLAGNVWRSEWIAGYVDYDHDRDLFELNFDDITAGVDTWYCDIEIQIVAPGSDVEYSWTLFRDAAPANDTLVERMYLESVGTNFEFEHFPEGGGIVASWADIDHDETSSTINVTIPNDLPDDPEDPLDQLFWIGKDSQGCKFYLSVNDFNRAVLSREWDAATEKWIPTPNPVPDNDWGYAPGVQPYYFQVTINYHNDRGCPEPYNCD